MVELTDSWYSPEFFNDPYPYYEAVRCAEPVHWSSKLNGWIVTGFKQVNAILRDPQSFSSAGRMAALLDALPEKDRSEFQPIYDHFAVGMIRCDPPDHTRLRRLISSAFTPQVVRQSRQNVGNVVDMLLDALPDGQEVDLVEAFAYPLPATVICRMLGVPEADLVRVRDWSEQINSIIAGVKPLAEAARDTQTALLDLQAYFRVMIEERRTRARDDLMSLLVSAESEGDRLTEPELISTAENLLAAGHETTKSLIANAVLTLVRHPDQLDLLRQKPELLPQALEEVLRYESPLQRQTRVVKHDTTYEGRPMRAGQVVFLMLGAANRDPEVFPEPGRFNIERRENPHIAFGMGVHFCIGAPLARLEGELALSQLLQRFTKMHLATDRIKWARTAALRCPAALPLLLAR